MNWVLMLVALVLAFSVIRGYRKGFLRIAYSLVSWMLVLAFVSWSTPYIKSYLMERTSVYESMKEYFEKNIRERAFQDGWPANGPDDEDASGPAAMGEEGMGGLAGFGIWLPESVSGSLFDIAAGNVDEFLEESGIYGKLAEGLAELAIEGIAFLIALSCAWLLVRLVAGALGIASRIPVVSGINRFLGLFAGGIYGLAMVSICFYAIALISASKLGGTVVSYIYRSPFLTYLYENNIIFAFVLRYF